MKTTPSSSLAQLYTLQDHMNLLSQSPLSAVLVWTSPQLEHLLQDALSLPIRVHLVLAYPSDITFANNFELHSLNNRQSL